MAIDTGAEGITVPYVESVEQVERCVGAVKYRPIKGKLLEDILSNRNALSEKTQNFLSEFNRNQYLIIGIESVAAVENLERMIDVEGVDGVFIGPHDLTVSMGIPTEYTHPEFINTVENIARTCREKGVGVGIHTDLVGMEPSIFAKLRQAGMNWMLHSADITILRNALNDQLRQLRHDCGDVYIGDHCKEPDSQVTQACIDTPSK
jgi:4-hydroxy-2-oxoheptanedioate aldolase